MNQVVRHSGMVGNSWKHLIEYLRRLFLFRVRLVGLVEVPEYCQCIENGGLVIRGIAPMDLLHGVLVSSSAHPMTHRRPVLIEQPDRFDESLLAVGSCGDRTRTLGRAGASVQLLGSRWRPKRVVPGHG